MRTSTLACSRCTSPVEPADRSCARCGQPRMRAVAASDDLRVEHGPPPTARHGDSGGRRGVSPMVLVACALMVVAAGLAALALWLNFWAPGPAGPPAPSATTGPAASAAPAPSPAPTGSAAPSASPSSGSGGGASLTGSASAQVPATSPDAVDGAREQVGYAASNMLDGDPATTWRMDGDGSGQVVTFALRRRAALTTVGLVNGYAKDDPATGSDRYAQTRRITRVRWTVGERSITQDLRDDDRTAQTVSFLATEAETITLRIDAVTQPGDPSFDQTAISEVVLRGR